MWSQAEIGTKSNQRKKTQSRPAKRVPRRAGSHAERGNQKPEVAAGPFDSRGGQRYVAEGIEIDELPVAGRLIQRIATEKPPCPACRAAASSRLPPQPPAR